LAYFGFFSANSYFPKFQDFFIVSQTFFKSLLFFFKYLRLFCGFFIVFAEGLLVIIIYFPAFFLLINFDLNPALLNELKVKKGAFLRKLGVNSSFFNFPVNNLGNSTWQGPIRTFFSMKNNLLFQRSIIFYFHK